MYSIIVNQIPRDWNVDSIKPLIASRYSLIVQVVRILRALVRMDRCFRCQ